MCHLRLRQLLWVTTICFAVAAHAQDHRVIAVDLVVDRTAYASATLLEPTPRLRAALTAHLVGPIGLKLAVSHGAPRTKRPAINVTPDAPNRIRHTSVAFYVTGFFLTTQRLALDGGIGIAANEFAGLRFVPRSGVGTSASASLRFSMTDFIGLKVDASTSTGPHVRRGDTSRLTERSISGGISLRFKTLSLL
jgi:hypothetical protein